MGRQLRVVLLTHPCERAARIVDGLLERGLKLDAVVLAPRPPVATGRRLLAVLPWHRVLQLALRRLAAAVLKPATSNWRRPEFYRARGARAITVPDLNSDECVRVLRDLDADIGVVGCSGVLRPHVFEVFRLGVLNIHPGLLPMFRGRSPVEWALNEGGEPGVTLHFIDAGIDTGPVVARAPVPLITGDTTSALYARADVIGVGLLADALRQAMDGRPISSCPQPHPARPAHRSAPRQVSERAGRLLAERLKSR